MASFSNSALMAISSFAGSLGLTANPARDGSFTFVFERSGTFSLTPSDDGNQALVSLARIPVRTDAAMERRALARAGLNPTTSRFLHAGLATDGSIVFSMALHDTDLDLPTLESCLGELVSAHAEIG